MNKTWEEITESNNKFRRQAEHSGMPQHTWNTCRLHNFLPNKGTEAGLQAAIDYVAEDDNGKPKRTHHFLTLGGDTGRGKTHLALGIGWYWLENLLGMVRYWTVSELLDQIRSEYDNPPKNQFDQPTKGELEWCKEISLLILDDLGAEKQTEWVSDKLDQLVNHRWLNELPTVITTNLVFSQLPGRLSSRLQEGVTVLLEGDDYRNLKAGMRKEETLTTE